MSRDEDEREETGAQQPTGVHRAHEVETMVVPVRGQWAVDIVVVFEDEVVRRRIGVHRSERLARISADLIKRASLRDIGGGPPAGMH